MAVYVDNLVDYSWRHGPSCHLIADSLDELMKGKTVIAIAHRLSTIARMDRLVILDKGRIVEQGTHDELLAADGHYAALWRRQSGGFIDAPDLAAAE